ncbi:MAG: DUF502 domain-containing protein [Marinilabiliaceae bacterium]|jgi:uncharacterized membrane protein|nr:DUF502 domain-containing protein [Marinilabiliaceae bacterium]
MKLSFFKRLKNFLKTTLLGGFAAILPMALIFIFFRWIFNIIKRYLEPIVNLVEVDTDIQLAILYVVVFAAVLGLFFFIGLVIRTRMGRFFNEVLEEKYLLKIPGYKIARDTVMQFFGKNRSFFSEVVLVDIFNSGTLMTGFITDDHEGSDFVTVFVPTGPNPTSGNIYHVSRNKVFRTNAAVDSGMKSIISCGAGSSEIFDLKIID